MAFVVAAVLAVSGIAAGASSHRAPVRLLPDLQILPIASVSLERGPGIRRVRFTTTIGDHGDGVLELLPRREDCDGDGDPSNDRTAYQRIYVDTNGNGLFDRDVDRHGTAAAVGCMLFHPAHNHWHFQDFARYELFAGPSSGPRVAKAEKVSFCVRDSVSAWTGPGHPAAPYYGECSRSSTMGLSVGWADLYGWELQGQALDVRGLPTGRYCLVATADPDDRLTESDEMDNTTSASLRIFKERVVLAGTDC